MKNLTLRERLTFWNRVKQLIIKNGKQQWYRGLCSAMRECIKHDFFTDEVYDFFTAEVYDFFTAEVYNYNIYNIDEFYDYNKKTYRFPELLKYRPIQYYDKIGYWWPKNEEGLKIRLEVIDNIIKDLKENKI